MTRNRFRCLTVAVVIVVVSRQGEAAGLQGTQKIDSGATIAITGAAPVYLLPDAQRTPLRILAVGTNAIVDRVQGEWIRITFNDPQFGRRTGWIEAKFARLTTAGTKIPPTPPPAARGAPAPKPGQSSRPPVRTAARRVGPTGRLFGSFAFDRMTAAESFAAITGSEGLPAFGIGVQGVNLWNQLFVESSVEYGWADGERAFVFDGEVFQLGIPVKIRMLPIDIVGGWRFALGRVTPLVGGGLTVLRYEETSDFADADAGEDVKEWHPGFVALAGVETRLSPTVHLRGEIRYRALQGALGSAGVSGQLGEDTLGGVGAAIKIVFGR